MKYIVTVYMQHKAIKHIRYVSAATPRGFKCGRCGRGNLGCHPSPKQECKVCHAVVKRVIWDEDRRPCIAPRDKGVCC